MEFSPRGFQRNSSRPTGPASSPGGAGEPDPDNGSNRKQPFARQALAQVKDGKTIGKLSLVLFISALVLAVAIILAIAFKGAPSEARTVDTENYQAVVLADGQAYFGKIASINKDYLVLQDVFYVQGQQLGGESNQQSQTAASLRKLGCEIHGPQDQMVIYRAQVTYWENLKSDGRVPQLIAQFKEENPNGQTCSTQSTDGQSNGTQPTGNSEESGTPGTNSTTPAEDDDQSDPTQNP